MRRLLICLAIAAGALAIAPAALADGPGGPITVTQGGSGVASQVQPGLRYVTVSDGTGGTLLETLDLTNGGVFGWIRLHGSWGIPAIGLGASGQGLSHDGPTLVVGSTPRPHGSPSQFLVAGATPRKGPRAD